MLDPRQPRKAKDFAGPSPGIKANGYNLALTNLGPQLTAADTLSGAFDWFQDYLAAGADGPPPLPALQATLNACRTYRRECTAWKNAPAAVAVPRTAGLRRRNVIVRSHVRR
jgi:hypothetical protein